jgi:hypothetical protein
VEEVTLFGVEVGYFVGETCIVVAVGGWVAVIPRGIYVLAPMEEVDYTCVECGYSTRLTVIATLALTYCSDFASVPPLPGPGDVVGARASVHVFVPAKWAATSLSRDYSADSRQKGFSVVVVEEAMASSVRALLRSAVRVVTPAWERASTSPKERPVSGQG